MAQRFEENPDLYREAAGQPFEYKGLTLEPIEGRGWQVIVRGAAKTEDGRVADLILCSNTSSCLKDLVDDSLKEDPCLSHKAQGVYLDPCCPACPNPEAAS